MRLLQSPELSKFNQFITVHKFESKMARFQLDGVSYIHQSAELVDYPSDSSSSSSSSSSSGGRFPSMIPISDIVRVEHDWAFKTILHLAKVISSYFHFVDGIFYFPCAIEFLF